MAEVIAPIIKKSIDDCNNADTGYYSFAVAPTNSPATDGGILLCIKSVSMIFQLYMSDAYGLFYRHKWYNNAWTGWENVRS